MFDCCCSQKDLHTINANINKALRQTKRNQHQEIKVLLLGAGESGKTTFIKQLKIILTAHAGKQGFTLSERQRYKETININLYSIVKDLSKGMQKLEIPFEHEENKKFGDEILALKISEIQLPITEEFLASVNKFWNDEGIQKCFSKSNKIQVLDCCHYFMTHCSTFADAGYVPTNQDIIWSRYQTTGVLEYKFNIMGSRFTFIDVGGQRNERRKWLHSFEGCTTAIFFAAIGDYDLTLRETAKSNNRVLESVKLFEFLISAESLSKAAFVVFLNKKDKLIEKWETSDIDDYIPQYINWRRENHKEKSIETCEEFIIDMFKQYIPMNRDVFFFFTVTTDTDIVSAVFDSVKSTVLKNTLQDLNLA